MLHELLSAAPAQGTAAECPVVGIGPPTDKRNLRFVNAVSRPRLGTTGFFACYDSFPIVNRTGDPCAP
jgi:hypothetical protein